MTSDEIQIDILMKEYTLLKQEVWMHFKNAKLHMKHFQAFVAAGLAITWYLFLAAEPDRLDRFLIAVSLTRSDLTLLVIFGLNIFSYYLAFDILDSYYCIFLATARLANIENQINNTWGRRLLIVESKFQQEAFAIFGASRATITAYQVFLVFVVSLILPLFAYWQLYQSFQSDCASHPIWLLVLAMTLCILGFLWFLYSYYDVFIFRQAEARRVVDELVVRGAVENKRATPLMRLLRAIYRRLAVWK